MHLDTGLLAVVGSLCMMLALVLAWCLAGVILESGLGETGAYWGFLSTALALETRVRVRPRRPRLERFGPVPQDGMAVATDLHALLKRGRVPSPLVLVGHSSGSEYVRIFAGRYPEHVAGMILLDGQPAEAFEGLHRAFGSRATGAYHRAYIPAFASALSPSLVQPLS